MSKQLRPLHIRSTNVQSLGVLQQSPQDCNYFEKVRDEIDTVCNKNAIGLYV